MDDFTTLLYSVDAGVATVTLNRPETLNALTATMMEELREAVARIGADSSIRAALLTGAGRGFCSGADLRNRPATAEDYVESVMRMFYSSVAALRDCSVPLVVAVNGTVAGGGFALALAGDVVIAARSAKFIQVFSRIGLVPDLGSTHQLPRAIGRARALRMMLTNDPLSAQDAVGWGLISECVDDDELMPAARAMAARLANGPTKTLVATRRLVDEGEQRSFEAQFRRELEVQKDIRETRDSREAVAAFLEKRPAVFRGE